jgi:RNase H-fold protein (predicted Holliday junction resolvase)
MPKKTIKILGINPGTKYIGIAIFQGPELRLWGVKVIKGKWSKEKAEKFKEIISTYIDRYGLTILAIKKIHPSRGSTNLEKLISEIKKLCLRKRVKIFSYSLQELEAHFSTERKINKKALAEKMAQDYPVLFYELKKEQKNKNAYFTRLFEAVALGSVCYYQNEK